MKRSAILLLFALQICISSGCRSSAKYGEQPLDGRVGPISFGHSTHQPSLTSMGASAEAANPELNQQLGSQSNISLAAYKTNGSQDSVSRSASQTTLPPGASQPFQNNGDGAQRLDEQPSDQISAASPALTLTLDKAEQLANSTNPDLQKARAEIESLQGKYLQSGLRPNPQVGYSSSDIGEEGTAGQQGAFFSQEFIRGGKLKLNRSIVCQEIEAAKQALEINRQKLMTEVRQRFCDLLVAQERMQVVQKFVRLSRDAVSISDQLFEAKEISKIANLRAQIQAKNIAVEYEQAENGLAAATRRLAAATGIGSPDTIESGSIIAMGAVYPEASMLDPQKSYNDLVAGSPELAQAFAELERAKWNLKRQVVEPTRNVQVQTSVTHGNVSGDDLVAIQVGVPLRINDRNQGNISSARSDLAVANQNIASINRDLSRRFSVAWRDYENARIQIVNYQNDIIPSTSEFYRLVESAYKEGEMGYLDLVSAQQTYLDVSLQNLVALQSYWRAAALIDGYLLSEN